VIRIRKPPQPPAILRKRGVRETKRLCNLYDAAPREYGDGTRTFDFDSGLYAAESVKTALLRAQHGKCCFCESKVAHISYGDVEHYRPKAGHRQNPDDPLGRPGYYWLAYDWTNLLFCCQVCNQRFKRNQFPLENPARRAATHRHDPARERPLFLNPAIDDPADFLDFRAEYVSAVGGNRRGEITLRELGLNREELAERRRDLLGPLKLLLETRELVAEEVARRPTTRLVNLLARLDAQLQLSTLESAEYAAMARAAMRSWGRPPRS
jgi:uncharacterized protein (TIGR02646 family)